MCYNFFVTGSSGDFFSHIGKPSASKSHHGAGSTGLSLPAIDLDTVAAMMQGGAGSSRGKNLNQFLSLKFVDEFFKTFRGDLFKVN